MPPNKAPGQGLRGWSTSNKLRTFSPSQQAHLQAKMQEVGAFTISFGISRNTDVAFTMPTAIVKWAVEGNQQQRIVSVTDGLSLSGVGHHPIVNLFDNLEAGMSGTAGQLYEAIITVAAGTRPSQNQPPTLIPYTFTKFDSSVPSTLTARYQLQVSLDSADTVVFPVPLSCGAISVQMSAFSTGSVLTDADYRFDLEDSASFILKSFGERSIWIPLVPGTTKIRVTNTTSGGGAKTFATTCLFGIDG